MVCDEIGLELIANATDCDLSAIPDECVCRFVRTVKPCRLITRLPYLALPKCDLTGDLEPIAGAVLLVWLVWIFAALGLVVEYNVVPNLVTISKVFNLSDIVAGVTLLALGNGITDIFTAVSSVYSAPDGGALAVSGLLGSSMFIFTVNSAVVAILYAPKVHLSVLTRDVGFYLLSLGWIGYMLSDRRLYALQGLVFVGIYIVYIAYIVGSNSRQQRWSALTEDSYDKDDEDDMDPESALLLGLSPTQSARNSPSVWSSQYEATGTRDGTSGTATPILPVENGDYKKLLADEDLSRLETPTHGELSSGRISTATINTEASSVHPEPGSGSDVEYSTVKQEWDRLVGLKGRSRFVISMIVIQFPLRVLLFLTAPVLRIGEYSEKRAWHKNHVILQVLLSVPLVVAIYGKEFSFDNRKTLGGAPLAVYGAVLGVFLAILIAASSKASEPPFYRSIVAFWGFFVAVTIVFAMTDEIVGLMRDFGTWLELSHSFIGIFVLGIGNGLNDLVANSIVAQKGWPNVAISAIYGGSILNLLIGMAICAAVGVFKYGDPYQVGFDEQNLLGLGASFAALFYVLVSLAAKGSPAILSKRDGIVLMALYIIFAAASLGLEIGFHRQDRKVSL